MSKIERYDCEGCRGYCYGGYHMAEAGEYGDYVKSEDHDRIVAALEAERDALRKGAEKTVKALAILHDGPDDSDVAMAEGMLTEAIGIFRAAIAAKEPK